VYEAVEMLPQDEDAGMWEQMQGNFGQFYSDFNASGSSAPITDDMAYAYVGCFLNSYQNASHNRDLWQAMYDCARTILVCANRYPPTS
jgi:hypothetical protein